MLSGALIALALCAAPAPAAVAVAERVHVAVKVAEASNKGSVIAPELAHMARDFKKKGLSFSAYRLLTQQALDIPRDAATAIAVPGGETITLTWTGESSGKLDFKVVVPGQPELNLSVHGGGCSFVEAGKTQDGSVVLMELKHQKSVPTSGTRPTAEPAAH